MLASNKRKWCLRFSGGHTDHRSGAVLVAVQSVKPYEAPGRSTHLGVQDLYDSLDKGSRSIFPQAERVGEAVPILKRGKGHAESSAQVRDAVESHLERIFLVELSEPVHVAP